MQLQPAREPHEPPARSGKLRVAVWSPYVALRRQLCELLAHSGEAEVLELADGGSLPQAVRDCDADVLVADIDRVGGSTEQAIVDIVRTAPTVRILALSSHTDPRLVERALRAGAAGYVVKDRSFEELPGAVRTAALGRRCVGPAVVPPDGRRGGGVLRSPESGLP